MSISFIPAFFRWSWHSVQCWVEAAHRLQRMEQGQIETQKSVSELAVKVDANAEEARREYQSLRREAAVEFGGLRKEINEWARTLVARHDDE